MRYLTAGKGRGRRADTQIQLCFATNRCSTPLLCRVRTYIAGGGETKSAIVVDYWRISRRCQEAPVQTGAVRKILWRCEVWSEEGVGGECWGCWRRGGKVPTTYVGGGELVGALHADTAPHLSAFSSRSRRRCPSLHYSRPPLTRICAQPGALRRPRGVAESRLYLTAAWASSHRIYIDKSPLKEYITAPPSIPSRLLPTPSIPLPLALTTARHVPAATHCIPDDASPSSLECHATPRSFTRRVAHYADNHNHHRHSSKPWPQARYRVLPPRRLAR